MQKSTSQSDKVRIELPAVDENGVPLTKMPDCPVCGDDELGMMNKNQAFCYRCCATVERREESMQGKRVEIDPGTAHRMAAGEYGYIDGLLYAMSPNGLLANLSGHNTVEHEDGTITASPSILVRGHDDSGNDKQWHGYLERGVWREC